MQIPWNTRKLAIIGEQLNNLVGQLFTNNLFVISNIDFVALTEYVSQVQGDINFYRLTGKTMERYTQTAIAWAVKFQGNQEETKIQLEIIATSVEFLADYYRLDKSLHDGYYNTYKRSMDICKNTEVLTDEQMKPLLDATRNLAFWAE